MRSRQDRRSDYAPGKRIREINSSEPYRSLGPWTLHDFRQVHDWRAVERSLHYTFRDHRARDIDGQRELFSISASAASMQLDQINASMLTRKPRIDRMFQVDGFPEYLTSLFKTSGLFNWLDHQGHWTLSLYPGTSGGRYYTINIGPHEVAFASIRSASGRPRQMLLMDRLVLDFPETISWVESHGGDIAHDQYASSLHRATSVLFDGDFGTALEFLSLSGVRRAVVAYWSEALLELQDRGVGSIYARHHNWNAVAELRRNLTLIGSTEHEG
ncbi:MULTISPECIES: GIY-YIG nuclease family protein [unclassified Rubrivivax]|uniref:GIY-YIG nuclease family protein n=1 Tax=unclassified Rubrivivax TaxID=2649762 RepID=UPI001E330B31|nr:MULTISPECIES: GIY-YIG nuclease family protein [unclassified Rubrivivax]MCC9595218.1 GIY-YIG nuclease family protein [Rubrivivax sp. JA1055]MCC9647989.1 GIY-YIG nuclease family protein [Rubrivivax sp. JA1029]